MEYTKHISYTVGDYVVEFDLKADNDNIVTNGVSNGTITFTGTGYGSCSNIGIMMTFPSLGENTQREMGPFNIKFATGESADAFTVASFGPFSGGGNYFEYPYSTLLIKFLDSQFNPNKSSDYASYSFIDNYEDYLPDSFNLVRFYNDANIPIGLDVSFTSDYVESDITFGLKIALRGWGAYSSYEENHILTNSSGVTQTEVVSKNAIEYCLNYETATCYYDFYVIYNGFVLTNTSMIRIINPVKTNNFYQNPQIDNLQVSRCLSDGTLDDEGTYLLIEFTPTFSSVYGYNSLTVQASYKEASASDYSQEEVIASGTIIGAGNIDQEYNYNLRLKVADMKSNFYLYVDVEKSFCLISMKQGGTGIALGQKSVNDNAFDVNLLANFLKNITIASGCSMTFTDQTTGHSVVVTGEKIEVHTGPIRWWSSSQSYADYDDIVTTINGPEISMLAYKNDKKNGVIMDINKVQYISNDSVRRSNDWYSILA